MIWFVAIVLFAVAIALAVRSGGDDGTGPRGGLRQPIPLRVRAYYRRPRGRA